ncbi:hypothetical protein RGCCGE502_23355 [Rhizobium grahamii CCGE 502]|uniref:Uncharacterized protein n=1 Tax=Rhizobium grahamii CCGE 502 TaxID=990285 RepID=S3HB74_9HYPH|nr:hypothetical protein RGCCGE502_23355 [Rhizobium grahamii CCGE 502]
MLVRRSLIRNGGIRVFGSGDMHGRCEGCGFSSVGSRVIRQFKNMMDRHDSLTPFDWRISCG